MIDDIFSMNLVPRLVVVIPTTLLRISVETVEEVDFRQPLEHVMTITFHRSHTHSRTHHFIGTRGGKGGYFGQVSVLAARAMAAGIRRIRVVDMIMSDRNQFTNWPIIQ